MNKWIPLDKEKPTRTGRYIITALEGDIVHVSVALYQSQNDYWVLTARRAYWKVIAWMPLPEPYREEDNT